MSISEFHWIQQGLLAGSGLPGLFNPIEEDIAFLKEQGIGLVVTLTEKPLTQNIGAFGLQNTHFPITDMSFPLPSAANRLCMMVQELIQANIAVLLHCYAGLGRTGTMLACCLISQGRSPGSALEVIRSICPQYVQSQGQENFLTHFAMLTEKKRPYSSLESPRTNR